MIWLIQDFDLLAVLLRALTLSLEALTIGGVLFLFFIADDAKSLPSGAKAPLVAPDLAYGLKPVPFKTLGSSSTCAANAAVARFASAAALALLIAQSLTAAESAVTLVSGSGLSLHEVMTADFFFADAAIASGSLILFLLLRFRARSMPAAVSFAAAAVLAGSVALSHSAARLDDRALLLTLTAVHHLGTAAWIGAMPCLLIAMRHTEDPARLRGMVRRFSNMALISVAALVAAGAGMACFYVGSWTALYGTSYGVMLLAKAYLLALILTLGAGNYFLVRHTQSDAAPLLARLRRFSEVEIGLGFTTLLVAASLTSQPPAVDMQQHLLTRHEIVDRLEWRLPSMITPGFSQLSKRSALKDSLESASFSGGSANDAMDRMWSEYNHHWAGIVVLAAGVFALLARLAGRRWPRNWFRNWPLLFLGLAVFIVLRADADAWPLGPRSFWGSFAETEVLEHRIFAVLITAFAFFEWAVETGRVKSQAAALVFPALCATGAAFLMTHSHSLGAVKEETLAEMSHSSIALLGATAGWSRWLQLRLPSADTPAGSERIARILPWLWPVCLVFVGVVLLNYRES